MIILVLGLLSGLALFARLRFLPKAAKCEQVEKLSVIIPARNEQDNLALLLKDLTLQTLPPAEIICVDDESTDGTAATAIGRGAKVVKVEHKPVGWVGKTYACQVGAQAALGNLLLFLDADVRLKPTALCALLQTYTKQQCAISVQPWHCTLRWYEQLSLFFNLIAATALGAKLPFRQRTKGLFGPVILISAADYAACGGHTAVKNRVLEDIHLGRVLDAKKIRYECFLGRGEIAYRMYAGGSRALVEGWTKNFASGAFSANPWFLAMVILWVCSLLIIPARCVQALAAGGGFFLVFYALLYAITLILLFYGGSRVGKFKAAAILVYPVCLCFFLGIFLLSLYKKIFHRPVRWKGRDIQGGL